MRKKICIGLLAVLLGTGLEAMIVNHIWKEPKQGVDLGVICRYSPQISAGNAISGSSGKGN